MGNKVTVILPFLITSVVASVSSGSYSWTQMLPVRGKCLQHRTHEAVDEGLSQRAARICSIRCAFKCMSVTDLCFCRRFSPCYDLLCRRRYGESSAVMDVKRTTLQGQKKSGAVNSEVTLPEIVGR